MSSATGVSDFSANSHGTEVVVAIEANEARLVCAHRQDQVGDRRRMREWQEPLALLGKTIAADAT